MSRVPNELMQRLHSANGAFADARAKLKNLDTMDAKQRSEAAAGLRSAEAMVEDLETQISTFLKAQDQSAGR